MEESAFSEIMGCLKKAEKEAVKTNRKIEEDRKEAIASIDDLLETIEGIPVYDID